MNVARDFEDVEREDGGAAVRAAIAGARHLWPDSAPPEDPEPVAEADGDEDSGGGLPIAAIIAGVVVLGLVGGLVAFLLLRRKGSAGPPATPAYAAPVPVAPGGAPMAPQPVTSTPSAAPVGFSGAPAAPPNSPPAAPDTNATSTPGPSSSQPSGGTRMTPK